jgi:capsular polysaccharide biosynthesis protein
VILGLVLLIVAAGLVISSLLANFMLPDSFASSALIVTGAQDPTLLQTQIEELLSAKILSEVITNLHLNKKWAERYKEESDFQTEQTLGLLRTQTKISQAKGAWLIRITVTGEDRFEAANIANEIAKVYAASSFVPKSSPVQILETAQPSFRPERPSNAFTWIAGLLIAGFGFQLLIRAARDRHPTPPPLPPNAQQS